MYMVILFKIFILLSKDHFTFTNSVDPDEMLHFTWIFTFCIITLLGVPEYKGLSWWTANDTHADLCLYQNIKFGSRREKTCLRWFANNKGADQTAHPRSLISAFVIRDLESIISRLAMS